MKKLGLFAFVGAIASAFAGSPVLKIDLDMSGRNSGEVTEPNYTAWPVDNAASSSKTVDGVKMTLSKGSAGTALRASWYKTGVQAPNYARLVCDGVIVEEGNNGGEISLKFENLPNGTHSLLTYHNNFNGESSYSNVDVYVDGTKKVTVKPTDRALENDKAATSYVEFTTSNGTATITYKPNGSATFKSVIINGFALNVPNSAAQAKSPSPANMDDHANHDNGKLTLSWTAASSAKKHQVYLGTDSATVAAATTKSAEYKGEQTSTTYAVTGAYALNTYYWRIDEVDANGSVAKGEVWRFRIGRLAFEGAEGYGRNAIGGRGGKVVYVTNLNDDGAGSLREACTADIGPRTIMFKVAGMIQLKSRLVCNHDYTTIAGQSAPGKGITIKSAPIGFTGNDMIIRFMRVRLGYGTTFDGMGLTGGNHSILDHGSISWTIDEAFSSRGGKNITLQRTLISEALNIADHQNYPSGTGHGYAATIGGDIGSFHHNLLAHNAGRNWSLGGGLDGDGYYAGRLDIFNNVVYNWMGRVTDGGAHEVNFVGNYYKAGAASGILDHVLNAQLEGTGKGSQEYYFHNNILQLTNGSFKCDGTNDECGRKYTLSGGQQLNWNVWHSTPYFPSYGTVQSAKAAYKDVLSDVGQRMPILDNHDQRMVNETKNGTYSMKGSVGGKPGIPDRETDVKDTANIKGWEPYPSTSWASDYDSDLDGLPDWWENMYGYNPKSKSGDFSESNKDRLGDGWTELERYLEWMARAHYTFAKGETQVIDLAQFTKGYDGGTYTVSAPTGVTATVSGSKMTVKLADNFAGVGYIKFTLKDNAGDTFTRNIGVTQMLAGSAATPASSSSVTPASSSSSVAVEPTSSETPVSSSSAGNGSTVVPSADGVYQAEDGTMTNADFEDKNAGFNGTGYVNFAGEGESIVEIPVNVAAAGTYTVTLRYALGKDETRELTVTTAKTTAQMVAFTSTGAWTTWETKAVTLELPAGESKITIATVSGDGPNLDQIELKADSTTGMAQSRPAQPFGITITDNIVMLTGIPEDANITVMDVSGNSIMMQKNVVQTRGLASVNMQPFGCGIYLVNIRGKLADGKKMNKIVKVMRR